MEHPIITVEVPHPDTVLTAADRDRDAFKLTDRERLHSELVSRQRLTHLPSGAQVP
jgi:hypothetical protein